MGVAPPAFDDLPRIIPIFPLAGVLLLPGGRLPLHIFEPRYRAMTKDALGGAKMIGMVQPRDPASAAAAPEIYPTGCLGHIVESNATEDGRFFLTLIGVCRFRVTEELDPGTLYRQAIADFAPFRADLEAADADALDRTRLISAFAAYCDKQGLACDWPVVGKLATADLVTAIAMFAPLDPREKQALLEARNLAARTEMVSLLMEMAASEPEQPQATTRLQ